MNWQTIYEHRDKIILGGLAIGILSIWGILPNQTGILGLGENLVYLWIGMIIFAGYVYHKIFMVHYNKQRKNNAHRYQQKENYPPNTPQVPEKPKTEQEKIKEKVAEKIKKRKF